MTTRIPPNVVSITNVSNVPTQSSSFTIQGSEAVDSCAAKVSEVVKLCKMPLSAPQKRNFYPWSWWEEAILPIWKARLLTAWRSNAPLKLIADCFREDLTSTSKDAYSPDRKVIHEKLSRGRKCAPAEDQEDRSKEPLSLREKQFLRDMLYDCHGILSPKNLDKALALLGRSPDSLPLQDLEKDQQVKKRETLLSHSHYLANPPLLTRPLTRSTNAQTSVSLPAKAIPHHYPWSWWETAMLPFWARRLREFLRCTHHPAKIIAACFNQDFELTGPFFNAPLIKSKLTRIQNSHSPALSQELSQKGQEGLFREENEPSIPFCDPSKSVAAPLTAPPQFENAPSQEALLYARDEEGWSDPEKAFLWDMVSRGEDNLHVVAIALRRSLDNCRSELAKTLSQVPSSTENGAQPPFDFRNSEKAQSSLDLHCREEDIFSPSLMSYVSKRGRYHAAAHSQNQAVQSPNNIPPFCPSQWREYEKNMIALWVPQLLQLHPAWTQQQCDQVIASCFNQMPVRETPISPQNIHRLLYSMNSSNASLSKSQPKDRSKAPWSFREKQFLWDMLCEPNHTAMHKNLDMISYLLGRSPTSLFLKFEELSQDSLIDHRDITPRFHKKNRQSTVSMNLLRSTRSTSTVQSEAPPAFPEEKGLLSPTIEEYDGDMEFDQAGSFSGIMERVEEECARALVSPPALSTLLQYAEEEEQRQQKE